MPRRLLLALLLPTLVAGWGCGHGRNELSQMARAVEAATPPADRPAVEEQMEALLALDQAGKLGDPEARALLDLYASAMKDGSLDEDERALLVRLTRDVVAGGGSVKQGRTPDKVPERNG